MTQILRLTQISADQGNYEFQLALQKEGEFVRTANVSFSFNLSAQDQERLRWYFEDYLQYPHYPTPSVANQIEQQLKELGFELFEKIFRGNDQACDLWAEVRNNISDTRVEIMAGVHEATSIPWELICDPITTQPLALGASSFIRTHNQAGIPPKTIRFGKGPIRILLAICRPIGEGDVPFRSVASRVIKGLSKVARSDFQLDVLRPPTFEELGRVLRLAKVKGEPYDVVHFDGHGAYMNLGSLDQIEMLIGSLSKIKLSGSKAGNRGYLLFENPSHGGNVELIDGNRLGNLLVETKVPILVLNACRSAYAESPKGPLPIKETNQMDAQSRILAFGSLAQEVMNVGVAGVVAMRYVVYVVTAAQFVAELYATLAEGLTLEEAVSMGRKQLHDNPQREIACRYRELQDWSVPIVYSADSLALFPRRANKEKLEIKISEAEPMPARSWLDRDLPSSPDTGFFGRDETLLSIDRAFDTQSIALISAYAGDGKTATASEFARWYSLTGGVKGPVLFTSFESHLTLPRLLDKIGLIFGRALESWNIQWQALNEAERREAALHVLKHIPILWIWDNVEPIAGFPTGVKSLWSENEQQDLADFLRAARDTQAKFLLTSRRDEKEWLGEIPVKIQIPPMPMSERVELAMSLAKKRGNKLIDAHALAPLLNYSQGNPLTIIVLVGQALTEGFNTRELIERFVNQLRAGEKVLKEDKASLGRSRSLEASLSYGFKHGFNDSERRILALLQFFQGFVDADVLMFMGCRESALEEMRGVTREDCIELLDRASEVGLLYLIDEGCYRIHPALPWYFRDLFQQYYKGRVDEAESAFMQAMAKVGITYHRSYGSGNREVIGALTFEEGNLLHARQLALNKGHLWAVIGTMQGLDQLYDQTGRRSEWERLVEEIVPYYMDKETDDPKSKPEELWSVVIGYRIRLGRQAGRLDETLRLQEKLLKWDQLQAEPFLTINPENLEEEGLNAVRNYILSIEGFGSIQRDMCNPECVRTYERALENYKRYGFRTEAANVAFFIGNAYFHLAGIRSLGRVGELLKTANN